MAPYVAREIIPLFLPNELESNVAASQGLTLVIVVLGVFTRLGIGNINVLVNLGLKIITYCT